MQEVDHEGRKAMSSVVDVRYQSQKESNATAGSASTAATYFACKIIGWQLVSTNTFPLEHICSNVPCFGGP